VEVRLSVCEEDVDVVPVVDVVISAQAPEK